MLIFTKCLLDNFLTKSNCESSSLYQSTVCQLVSECVWMFPNSSEMANSSELKFRDDSPWDKEGFRLKNIWIRRTVSRKIACILTPHSTLAVNSISLKCDSLMLRCVACCVMEGGERIGEVGRGWGDL